ncbi:MAG: hypothetical protein JWO36_5799, partial [Myxococcales bacterium]|nr:hypothetical protein [Myxococcales bacterium]
SSARRAVRNAGAAHGDPDIVSFRNHGRRAKIAGMIEHSRYRFENDEPVVDVRVGTIEQLFDNRDPAPFRERDLDPELSEYLVDAGEDLWGHDRFRVVFWLDKPCRPSEIEQAYRAHFTDKIERNKRTRRRRRRTGQVALVLALALIVALLSFAQFVASLVPGSLGTGLKEGLVISSWVVMWRPVETLIYDWIPTRHERKLVEKLLDAPIEVRAGDGPSAKT